MIPDLRTGEINRFRARITKGDGCWTWTGDLNNKGYGVLAVYRQSGRRRLLAHRIAYFLATGDDPAGRVVRHRCDNPPCVRGDHLQIGTQADNMRDAKERGRFNPVGLEVVRRRKTAAYRERMAAGVKHCSACDETKPLEQFHRNRSVPDGRQGHCKLCKNTQERAQRAAAPKRPLVPCGTETAYRRHLKAGEIPCEPCRYANRLAARRRMAGVRARRLLEQPAGMTA